MLIVLVSIKSTHEKSFYVNFLASAGFLFIPLPKVDTAIDSVAPKQLQTTWVFI